MVNQCKKNDRINKRAWYNKVTKRKKRRIKK